MTLPRAFLVLPKPLGASDRRALAVEGIVCADEVAATLKQRIKSYIGISAGVVVHAEGGIPRSEGKARRVVDKRGD